MIVVYSSSLIFRERLKGLLGERGKVCAKERLFFIALEEASAGWQQAEQSGPHIIIDIEKEEALPIVAKVRELYPSITCYCVYPHVQAELAVQAKALGAEPVTRSQVEKLLG